MKMKKLWIGIPLIMLAFGIMLAGCIETNGDDEFVEKWYTSQAAANNGTGPAVFEFTSGGKLLLDGDTLHYSISKKTGLITVTTISGEERGNATIQITGTKLTIGQGTPIPKGDYFKAESDK
jgi:hypothetical protein